MYEIIPFFYSDSNQNKQQRNSNNFWKNLFKSKKIVQIFISIVVMTQNLRSSEISVTLFIHVIQIPSYRNWKLIARPRICTFSTSWWKYSVKKENSVLLHLLKLLFRFWAKGTATCANIEIFFRCWNPARMKREMWFPQLLILTELVPWLCGKSTMSSSLLNILLLGQE